MKFLIGSSKNSISEGILHFWLYLLEMVLIHTFWSNQVHNHLLCPKMHELPHNKQDIVCPRVHQQGTRVLSRKVNFNYLGFKDALNQKKSCEWLYCKLKKSKQTFNSEFVIWRSVQMTWTRHNKKTSRYYVHMNANLLELVSKELNHLAAILHVYAGDLNFMK